jgi:hypothetical protein
MTKSDKTTIDDVVPYIISILMIVYGSLLLHHCNILIRDKMDPESELSKGTQDCKLSDDILLEQGLAIILITLGVFVFGNTMYSRHPKFFHNTIFFSNKDSDEGGHPFLQYIQMMVVLGFAIFIFADTQKHKECIGKSGGISGDNLLYISNLIIIITLSIWLIYKGGIITKQLSDGDKKKRPVPKPRPK